MSHTVYLDYAATTPTDSRVIEAMLPYFNIKYGNASSLHSAGTESKLEIEKCREQIAGYIKCSASEFIFTSSGTESNNLALKGAAFANRSKGNHIIVSSIEHDCILNTCKWLQGQGFAVSYLPVDKYGFVSTETLEKFITPKTILVSVMHANNEIGTIQNVKAIGQVCCQRNVLFHSDACQSFGKIPIDVCEFNIDLLTINAHKIYGPKGVGGLYIRKGVKIDPWLHGGGQEFGIRSSTENVAGIVGFAKAAELCFENFETESSQTEKFRNEITSYLLEKVEGAYINGHPTQRLPGNINLCIQGLEGEAIRLLLLLDESGIAVSAGSACSSNDKSGGASHVLQAIGLNQFEARGSIRISLGRFNTKADVNYFIEQFSQAVLKLKPIFT